MSAPPQDKIHRPAALDVQADDGVRVWAEPATKAAPLPYPAKRAALRAPDVPAQVPQQLLLRAPRLLQGVGQDHKADGVQGAVFDAAGAVASRAERLVTEMIIPGVSPAVAFVT